MPIVAAIIAVTVLLWAAIYARRGSLIAGCGLMLLIAYTLGHEFWNTQIGPLPITLDRLLLVGLIAACVVRWRLGQVHLRCLTTPDYALAVLMLIVVMSAVLSGQPEFSDGMTSKWGRLLAGFIIPTALYIVIRQLDISRREWKFLLASFAVLGVYLAVTAFCEVKGQWSLVYPRYIADANRGIHFGRARGPELNAVSLGIYLTACFWCAWTLANRVQHRWQQLALLAVLPIVAIGVYYTYTRSTWLGLAASALVVGAIEIPRRWRLPTITMAAVAGVLVLATAWTNIVGLQREGTASESEHSVDQRKSFAYVSWQMFRDNPLVGVGFGRFYDRKLPYLSDRSQEFELESIRPLHHHNTFLSVLTETGVVGLAAFVAVLATWSGCAWRLVRSNALPHWARAHGVLTLALIVNYLCSALFHDLTLLPSQHLLLFAFVGLAVNMQQQRFATTDTSAVVINAGQIPANPISRRQQLAGPAARIRLFGMQIDNISLRAAVARILDWCHETSSSCRYIVTPNVDHAVMFQHRPDLRAAYDGASLVLADGAPIVVASRLLRRPLPERVAGSDLVPAIFRSATEPLSVFLLGAAPGVAEQAAGQIQRKWPTVRVVGTYSPPLGFENDDAENMRILQKAAESRPDLVIVGFGAPKQELWVSKHCPQLHAKVVICAGATIDFLAGHRRRSPIWMRRAGLEWLHRVCSEPRRLASRYARDAWVFPQLLWKEFRAS
jgi:N-acetylglucosaminyldiphosphoundecaprenol N-acetyl-beta-D-mannosaminyltransferase